MKAISVITTLSILAILLVSSAAAPLASAKSSGGGVTTFSPAAPTFVGSPAAFLTGPTQTSPFTDQAVVTDPPGPQVIPNHDGKGIVAQDIAKDDPPAPGPTIPPTVDCSPISANGGCQSITNNAGGATTQPFAMNAVNSKPFTVEPPDQGLCGGNGYIMETLNQGQVQIFSANTLAPVSSVISLDTVMGLTTLGWSSGGDIMCNYDYANGGHWFITQIVSANSEASGGPFVGCFAGVTDTCYEGIAVSTTNNPMGSYNVYFLNANEVDTDPGVGSLLNDFAKIATTNDAFLLFYDEFQLPSGLFNGAQEFAFTKSAMELGLSTSNPSFNVAYENMGSAPNLYPIPANGAYQPFPLTSDAWYQVIPATSPDPSDYNNANGGTGFMVGTLDFLGAGDNRVAVFDWTQLSTLDSLSCSSCGAIAFGGQLLTGGVTYMDEGANCLDNSGISSFCGLAPQKAGPIPLGDNCNVLPAQTTFPCPEGGIATNGDGATQASYSQGELWSAVSTVVNQQFGGSSELHLGATYWGVSTTGSSFSIAQQGYISPAHEDIEFPSIAAGDGPDVLFSFTLNGNGGPTGADNGGYYPSSAYALLNPGGKIIGHAIYIADLGKAPQDGFTEYMGYTASFGSLSTRPRWGDYGAAIYIPATHGQGTTYFASEYIQYPACSDSAYLSDPTCGGTRAPMANWGSSINSIGT